jgi:UDP-N-acetylglucosamine acyltransferase
MPIHPTAIVDPRARMAESAEIGPYCVVGAEVEIGARTRLMANLYLEGPTWIGEDNVFFPYSTVGVALAGPEVQGRARRDAHRRPQPHPRVRHHPSRHRGRRPGHFHRQR